MDCPDENVLVAFAAGRLPAERRAQLEHHLDTCELCGVLVAEAARDPDPSSVSSLGDAPTQPGRLLRGTCLGRYLVVEQLGSGGLGDVYACYDPELDRRVAIKLLRTVADDPERAQLRLRREAQALARLAHPNVVAVHDVGAFGGRVFVAMELVDGQTLREWIAAGPHGWRAVRDLMVEAGRGLWAAHAAGMVHRDFKPSNVMIGRDGRVRVLDFGLARAATPTGEAQACPSVEARGGAGIEAVLTRTGTILGTPAYMAPEQFVGDPIDERADQFGYCCTVYEALHGVRPFKGRSLDQLFASVRAGPAEGGEGAPAWFRRAIVRGLAFDPARRFADMGALLDALDRDRRSRRWQVGALVGALVTGVVGLGVGRALTPVSAAQREAVEQRVTKALAAAARGYFIYPPVEDPQLPTAWVHLHQLETMGTTVARERAVGLRQQLATALVELGDRYWDRDGGRPFAIEYYAQALVFDDGAEVARRRAVLTGPGLEALRSRARTLDFAPGELLAAEPLVALSHDDPAVRRREVQRVTRGTHLPAVLRAGLEQLEPGDTGAPTASLSAESGAAAPSVATEVAVDPTAGPDADADKHPDAAQPPPPTDTAPPPDPAPSIDRVAARSATAQGLAALSRGGAAGLDAAAQAFHRALAADPRHGPALAGLSTVEFERGHFSAAERFARKAVGVEPRQGSHRILLGDCLLRQLRYPEARAQYERAQRHHHPSAAKRLASLAALTG